MVELTLSAHISTNGIFIISNWHIYRGAGITVANNLRTWILSYCYRLRSLAWRRLSRFFPPALIRPIYGFASRRRFRVTSTTRGNAGWATPHFEICGFRNPANPHCRPNNAAFAPRRGGGFCARGFGGAEYALMAAECWKTSRITARCVALAIAPTERAMPLLNPPPNVFL